MYAKKPDQSPLNAKHKVKRSYMHITFLKRQYLLFFSFLLMLSACQSIDKNQTIKGQRSFDSAAHQDKLAALTTWRIAGKLGVITPEERTSVYINWEQKQQVSDIKMTNILGVQLARIVDNLEGARLESDGEVFKDKSV